MAITLRYATDLKSIYVIFKPINFEIPQNEASIFGL